MEKEMLEDVREDTSEQNHWEDVMELMDKFIREVDELDPIFLQSLTSHSRSLKAEASRELEMAIEERIARKFPHKTWGRGRL